MVEADRDVSFLGTSAVAPKSRMAARGIPLPSPSPLLLPPPQPSFVQRLVVALMPPPLILSTLPPPLNAQPRPIEAPSPLVILSTGASPLVCLSFAGWLSHRLLSPASASRHISSGSRRMHPSSTPPLCSLFTPAGCHVASLCTASASRRAGPFFSSLLHSI
jgi:hypothetical protein